MEGRKKKSLTGMVLAAVLTVLLGVQTAFGADYVNSVNITLNVELRPEESLPSLDTGYTSDGSYEVMIPSNEKYDIVSAKWSSNADEARLGGTYTMKITLSALNDYRFASNYSSSKVKVKGGTFVSAQKQGSDRLIVTVKTRPAEGQLEAPEDASWESTRGGSSRFGIARWEKVSDAEYEAYLYRGSKLIHKATELHTTAYDFYPYMTSKGTYTFRVRAVPENDTVAKYADRSDWTHSDELDVDSDEVYEGEPPRKNINEILTGTPDSSQVGWITEGGRWFYRYPDGQYQKDGWAYILNEWYLFDGYGVMETGWRQKDGSYYYLNEDGKMQTGWLFQNGQWYYLLDSGAMAVGWLQMGDKTYYMFETGVMATGWQEIGEQIFYFYPDGHKAVNEVIDSFYVDMNGVWKR